MIRKATEEDLSRIAEIFVFNNRINYFPIFKQEEYSFGELQVVSMIDHYFGKEEVLENLYVADECGIVKGFMEIHFSIFPCTRTSLNVYFNNINTIFDLIFADIS